MKQHQVKGEPLSIRKFLALVAAVLVLAGCGAQPPASQPAETAAGQSPTQAPSEAPSATQASGCEPVSAEMLAAIASGAEDNLPITPVAGAAVKSTDYEKVYMIAMKFSAAGGGDEVGVWASDSLEPGGGLIIAVDGFAQQFTHWPKGDQTKFKITQADHGVAESEACVK